MAIITASDYKTYKGISASTYDAQLAVVIPAIQELAEDYCDRLFDSASRTEKHNGTDFPVLVLRNTPVTTLTSISIIAADGTSTTVDADTYTFDANSGVVKFQPASYAAVTTNDWGTVECGDTWKPSPRFEAGHQNVSVVYTGGYTSGTMPANLKFSMYQAVDIALGRARGGVGVGDFRRQDLGDYSEERFGLEEAAKAIEQLFNTFRRII